MATPLVLPEEKPIRVTYYIYDFGAMKVTALSYTTRASVAEFGMTLAKIGGLYDAAADRWIPYHQIISLQGMDDGPTTAT